MRGQMLRGAVHNLEPKKQVKSDAWGIILSCDRKYKSALALAWAGNPYSRLVIAFPLLTGDTSFEVHVLFSDVFFDKFQQSLK